MKIKNITPAPWNTRTAITEESIAALAGSMKADGLIQPISVCDNEDGTGYICYDGNRRLAAAKALGWKDIDANYTKLTIDEAKVRTVTANLQREADDPLLAASVIAAMLEKGNDAGQIAAKLGKTVAWVNRRRKMIGAADALKACANKVTVEALEHIAVLPEVAQNAVCNEVRRMAKYLGRVGLTEIRSTIEREMRDLDSALFDCEPCAGCVRRTGVEADLFGVCDAGKLGKCLDHKCYEKRRKEWKDAEIKKAVGDAEVVTVGYSWELPDSGKDMRDKRHPCAYVFVDGWDIVVKWDESQSAKKRREEAAERKRNEEKAAKEEERKREREITNRLDDWSSSGKDNEWPAGLVGTILDHCDSEWVIDKVANDITSWQTAESWADILRNLPEIAKFAGISEEDRAYLVERYADDGGGEE